MKIPINIATNWDPDLIPGLAALNRVHHDRRVAEVFGSHQLTPTGTARPRERLPAIDDDFISQYVGQCHFHEIRFNYLLNGLVPAQTSIDQIWLHELSRHLERLQVIGIDLLTVANANVIRWIRQHFPSFSIKASLLAQVDSVEKAKIFEDTGVETIVLDPFRANRDFATLRAIRKAVRCQLELYSNVSCLAGCPVSRQHYGLFSQSSAMDTKTPRPVSPDPYLGFCSLVYLQNPVELLKSPFIRPDDIGEYAALGIDRFKLSDRSESTEYLLTTAKAYLGGFYTGDLFSLVFRDGSKFSGGMHPEDRPVDRHNPFAIDNQALQRLHFFEAVSTLSGDALDRFYEHAAAVAMRVADKSELENWERRYPVLTQSLQIAADKRLSMYPKQAESASIPQPL
jgi:collagenase-like PrtC family protease